MLTKFTTQASYLAQLRSKSGNSIIAAHAEKVANMSSAEWKLYRSALIGKRDMSARQEAVTKLVRQHKWTLDAIHG